MGDFDHLIKQGLRVPTLREYAVLLNDVNHEDDFSIQNQFGSVTTENLDFVQLVQSSPGRYRLMPGPEFSPRLYRGQNEFCSPGLPAIHRDTFAGYPLEPIDRVYWESKIIEFWQLLLRHPASLHMKDLIIEGMIFDFNIQSVAQHYNFPTNFIDFSRSRDVAMFFATCRQMQPDIYEPKRAGQGVLYTADLKAVILDESSGIKFLPLGLEPLPRPIAQKALAIWLNKGEDLNLMPWIKSEIIEITPELSRYYFDKFNGGKSLFPSDSYDQTFSRLRDNRIVRFESVEWGLSKGWLPEHPQGIDGVLESFKQAGYHITEAPVHAEITYEAFHEAEIEWIKRQEFYLNSIMKRGVCDHVES